MSEVTFSDVEAHFITCISSHPTNFLCWIRVAARSKNVFMCDHAVFFPIVTFHLNAFIFKPIRKEKVSSLFIKVSYINIYI